MNYIRKIIISIINLIVDILQPLKLIKNVIISGPHRFPFIKLVK